jgi:ferredoxin
MKPSTGAEKAAVMKTTLYYFTGTGNSFAVANDLAQELGNTEIIPIGSLVKKEGSVEIKQERVGIVFPVYMWGLPLIVARFASKIAVTPGAYIFGIVTYGGSFGATLRQLAAVLADKGNTLSAGFGIRMPGNYTPMYGALPETKQQRCFSSAKEKICRIVPIIRNNEKRKIESGSFFVNLLFSKLFYSFSAPHIPGMDKSYWVNDRCNGCAVCAKVCPVNNITIKEEKPVWHHACEQCMACMQWCPQEAIQFGGKTQGRKRYRHPDVTLQDIINGK